MNPIFNTTTCTSADEFITKVKNLNTLDWSNNNITENVVKDFIDNNEGYFSQVMTRANGRQQMGILAARVKNQFPASLELLSKISNVSTASFEHLPSEIRTMIVGKTVSTPVEVRRAGKLKPTSKGWNKMTREAQLKAINQDRVALADMGFSSHYKVINFLKRLNKEENPQEGQTKEAQATVRCLNVKNYRSTPYVEELNGWIDEILKFCPHAETLIMGVEEMYIFSLVKKAAKLKNFHLEVSNFTFIDLQGLNRLGQLYPSAQIHIDPKGNFAANAKDALDIIPHLKEGEYVICPRIGHPPGIYSVYYKVGETIQTMTLGPPASLEASASTLINREINMRIWSKHPEIPLAELHLTPTDLLDFLKRQPVASHVLNFAGLENYIGRIRNAPGYTYVIEGGSTWDEVVMEILKFSGVELHTLHANATTLHLCHNLPTLLKDSGCNQVTKLKIEGNTNNWRRHIFDNLGKIQKAYPNMKIELPKMGHFVGSSQEAALLLNDMPNESYALWSSKSTPGAYGFLIKINGKIIDKPILLNPNAQNFSETYRNDLLTCILDRIQASKQAPTKIA